jgi:hypothetical protein
MQLECGDEIVSIGGQYLIGRELSEVQEMCRRSPVQPGEIVAHIEVRGRDRLSKATRNITDYFRL